MFEDMAPRRTRRSERQKITEDWRKLCNEELHTLFSSPKIVISEAVGVRWTRHVASMGEMRNAYRISRKS
jgi:hypothetical protein